MLANPIYTLNHVAYWERFNCLFELCIPLDLIGRLVLLVRGIWARSNEELPKKTDKLEVRTT
jgi:hypothetical protein